MASKKISVTGANGKVCERVGGSCACCDAQDNGRTWFVYRAGWCDSDGVYYARLCGDRHGTGCISEVIPDKDKSKMSDLLLELMPNEADDGVVTMMEDREFYE